MKAGECAVVHILFVDFKMNYQLLEPTTNLSAEVRYMSTQQNHKNYTMPKNRTLKLFPVAYGQNAIVVETGGCAVMHAINGNIQPDSVPSMNSTLNYEPTVGYWNFTQKIKACPKSTKIIIHTLAEIISHISKLNYFNRTKLSR